MRSWNLHIAFLAAILLTACGGGETAQSPSAQRLKLADTHSAESSLLIVNGNSGSYLIKKLSTGYSIANNTDGTIISGSANLKRVQFSDISLALDIDTAGKIFRLYQAAFNRLPDLAGTGFWLAYADAGHTLEEIANWFLQSAEFQKIYGPSPTDLQFITKLYNNVLHRDPDAGGLKFWLDALQNNTSRAQALVYFSESAENIAQAAPQIADGVAYAQTGVAYKPVSHVDPVSPVTAGTAVTLDGSDSTDANGDLLSFRWTVIKPDGTPLALSTPAASKVIFTPDVSGNYKATLVVSDGIQVSDASTISVLVSQKVVAPIADTGTYTCSAISHALAEQLYLLGHTYLDRDHDGKPCEATDIQIEINSAKPTTPVTPTAKQCYVNGYYRKNGTYVRGYWRSC